MLETFPLTTTPTTRLWVHSDLQLSDPVQARAVLAAAVDEVLDLGIDAIWCLGDATCGIDPADIDRVAAVTVEQFDRLQVPVCYVLGNHEMDLKRTHQLDRYPLYERARQLPHWHTMACGEAFYFARRFGEVLVVFMGDHFAEDGRWWTTHGVVHGDTQAYPHPPEAYAALREAIHAYPGPVVIASHYALPGGQRPSELLRPLLPLPANVRLHCHGHAHIGDLVHNREFPYRRKNPIHGQSLKQFNISALETVRSAGSHSAILDLGSEGPQRLRIRCHQRHQWTENFYWLPAATSTTLS